MSSDPVSVCSVFAKISTLTAIGAAVCFAGEANATERACNHDSQTFKCLEYVRNYDGDTITFQIPDVHPLLGSMISVRLAGIDTPEINGKKPCERELAQLAKQFVHEEMESAYDIELRHAQRGKYFRIIGSLIYDGRNLSHELIQNGFALPYDGGDRSAHKWCRLYHLIQPTEVPAAN